MDKQSIKTKLNTINGSATLGIDGMIDEVWELIDSRASANEFTKINNLLTFGQALTERKTGGIAKERILKRRSNGGFVCNTGRAVATLGIDTTFLGMFGDEPYEEIFDEFKNLAQIYSIGKPANIHVLEFVDGKILMPNLQPLITCKWEDILAKFGHEKTKEIFNKDIIGVGYWSNMYDFENTLKNIVEICVQNKKTKRVFHDFANLNKRTNQALLCALDCLKTQNEKVYQTLSLNEHEGGILCNALGVEYPKDINRPEAMQPALEAVIKLRNLIGIDEVVIHSLHFAVSSSKTNGDAVAQQKYCENAVKTTGAGDTFNGGYMVASLAKLSQTEKLIVSNAATYYYVSTGNAPNINQVVDSIYIAE